MTVKRSFSLPDDVAEWLDRKHNASAAVTEAIRAQINSDRTEEILRASGFNITEEGKRRWRERLRKPISPEALAEKERWLAALREGRLDEYRREQESRGE
jgi:hypothetical protein